MVVFSWLLFGRFFGSAEEVAGFPASRTDIDHRTATRLSRLVPRAAFYTDGFAATRREGGHISGMEPRNMSRRERAFMRASRSLQE